MLGLVSCRAPERRKGGPSTFSRDDAGPPLAKALSQVFPDESQAVPCRPGHRRAGGGSGGG